MDIKKFGMSGIKASRINQQSFRIPVMLLTAYSESDFIEEALKVIGYIVKQISEKDLIPAVEMALGQLQIMQSLLGNIKQLG